MKKRNHENWLKAFVAYASHLEAPLNMYFWVGVSTIAGALRRCVWIDQIEFQWIPNFYVVLVAPPGIVSKGTTASIGMKLLREVPDIRFGPDVVTWPALTQALAQANEGVLMPDGTYHPMSALTIESAEFGNFLNPSDREMVDILVTLWDGKRGALKKLTKTQGEDLIINPWLNIIACTTPAWIEGSFPEYMVGGGFTSRCIFVYADKKRNFVAYPAKVIPENHVEIKQKLVDDLIDISLLRGPYELTSNALAWGDRWYKYHNENRPKHLDNSRFGGYIARKQTHIHKLAMIYAAAQRQEMRIEEEDLIAAEQLITLLEDHMTKVFEGVGISPQAKGQAETVAVIQAYGALSLPELCKALFRTHTQEEVHKCVSSSIAAGYVQQFAKDGQLMVRAIYAQEEQKTELKLVKE